MGVKRLRKSSSTVKKLHHQVDGKKAGREEEGVKWPRCLDGLAVTFTEIESVGRIEGMEEGKTTSSLWDTLTSQCLRDTQLELDARQWYKPICGFEEWSIYSGGPQHMGYPRCMKPSTGAVWKVGARRLNMKDTTSCLRRLSRVQRDGKQSGEYDVTDPKGEGILQRTCDIAGIVPDTMGIHLKKRLCFKEGHRKGMCILNKDARQKVTDPFYKRFR